MLLNFIYNKKKLNMLIVGKREMLKSINKKKLPIIHSEVSQKEKHQYSILMHIYGIQKDGNNNPVYKTAKETLMYRTVLWTLWERERLGRFGRMALKHVKYHV